MTKQSCEHKHMQKHLRNKPNPTIKAKFVIILNNMFQYNLNHKMKKK